jgi:hypothetical protein
MGRTTQNGFLMTRIFRVKRPFKVEQHLLDFTDRQPWLLSLGSPGQLDANVLHDLSV